jgi:hypothetical protein
MKILSYPYNVCERFVTSMCYNRGGYLIELSWLHL